MFQLFCCEWIQILKSAFLFTITNRSYRKYICSGLILGGQVILFQSESLGDRGKWMLQIKLRQPETLLVVPVIRCWSRAKCWIFYVALITMKIHSSNYKFYLLKTKGEAAVWCVAVSVLWLNSYSLKSISWYHSDIFRLVWQEKWCEIWSKT